MAGEVTSTLLADKVKNVHVHSAAEIARSKLALETKKFMIPGEDLRIWDSATNAQLPNTPATDDLGLSLGVFTTSGLSVQSNDFGGTTALQYARFHFRLPEEYEAGGTITFAMFAGMLTTIGDGTTTLDAEIYYKDPADATMSADLCTTGATTCNSLTLSELTFTVTPTSRVNGDELQVRIAFVGNDSGNLGVMRCLITQLYFTCQVRG